MLGNIGQCFGNVGRRGAKGVNLDITADFTSIDRSPEDTAPIFYLPFDVVGARHPGMTGARSLVQLIPTAVSFTKSSDISPT